MLFERPVRAADRTVIVGMLGVAVLASVFTANGSYASPTSYANGVEAALPIAAVVLGVGAAIALLVPGRLRLATPAEAEEPERAPLITA